MKFSVMLCAAALVGSTLGLIVESSSSVAATSTCSNRGNYFAGARSGVSQNIYGGKARIEYNNPDLCGSDTTGSSWSIAWSMVTAQSASSSLDSRDGWAQSGYGQFARNSGYSQGIRYFAQWTKKCKSSGTCGSETPFVTRFGAGAVSGSHHFKNYLSASDGHVHMYKDGTKITETSYNPANDWDPAWAVHMAGETYHKGSDVPGKSSDVTTFDFAQYYNGSGNLNFLTNINPVLSSSTRYHVNETNPGSGGLGINIWTNPLS